MFHLRLLPNFIKGTLACLGFVLLTQMGCNTPSDVPGSLSEHQQTVFRGEIESVLMRQQDAWNRGDIPGFMDDYVKSDTLRFTSDGTVRYGWQASLDRYYNAYPNRDAMGDLTFSDLKIDILSSEWALVFGAWNLIRGGDYEDIGGTYTLLMNNGANGWKVLYDHTSTLESNE